MSTEFIHLHVHSQYSLLDGSLKIKDLIHQVVSHSMKAVAVTDHGNMFGAISFYKVAKALGVQPILGCELEIATKGRSCHLPVLAATNEGYANLVWLVSRGHVQPDPEGSPGLPCVSLSDVVAHSRGLIALTGCMGGLVPQAILEEGEFAGAKMLAHLKEIFEPGSLYVELQDHGFVEQPVLNRMLVELAAKCELPLVATNDCHFGSREDADTHLYLSCIKSGYTYEEGKKRHHGASEMYLKSPAEMAQQFQQFPEALKNTLEIAEKTQLKLVLGEPIWPTFHVPEGYTSEEYFRYIAQEGLKARFREWSAINRSFDADAYERRLASELDVISSMKYTDYFLIVWDFIRFAREQSIPVGPGRGSGAGSLVAYAMQITDIDPLEYSLLFERFLNPERVSLPDFDIDFCMDRRDQVIAYVQSKYGEQSVGHIATFAELKSKSVVKDVARCMGISPSEAQVIANLIPRRTPAETYSIVESLDIEPKLKARYELEPQTRQLLTQAQKLEGLTRHAGKHAAGIVVSQGPLWNHVPVFKDEKTGAYITQYYKDDVELAGLIKFDFLGLKTLTVLDVAQRLINARPDYVQRHYSLDLAKIPKEDKETFRLLASGETKGVFQVESSGMQQLFKDLKADSFEDIIAAVALYRPGPLGTGMVTDFINRKHGRVFIGQMHPLVDSILAPTYGVIVYQEQVMQIAQALAGYSLGEADLLRRAMGKKKPEEMAKQKDAFVQGAIKRGVAHADAERIFGFLEYFAGYGFNKSHSAAYALITYQTAYLKAHYPVEFLCAIMTSDKDKIDKVVRTIAEARSIGVTVLPPDINESDTDFKVVYTHPAGDRPMDRATKIKDPLGPQIRFGLGAVRGLGQAALEAIFEARQVGGPFMDMFDFAARVDVQKVNKVVFEALIQCGAFGALLDPLGVSRASAFASIDIALERSRAATRDRRIGQTNLFGLLDAPMASAKVPFTWSAGDYVACEPWDRRETLLREKQSLGFYISGHPLERYLRGERALAQLNTISIADCAQREDWEIVRLVGMVEGYREKVFRDRGGRVAFFELEDLTGRISVKVRPPQIEACAALLTSEEPILVTGRVSFPRREEDSTEEGVENNREPTLTLNQVQLLSDVLQGNTRHVIICLREDEVNPVKIDELYRILQNSEGNCPVFFNVFLRDGTEVVLSLGKESGVEIGDRFLADLERAFGYQIAELG
ncbi:DNA polymerase III subunit alpha [Pajaroellobacter abortibovis]|uniref:DNA polymerase III subunit alpha n=1 Tax=Pajaroellobacter abortibovis TaxID=1882918 RepID=A0A1L6MZ61_9BACT|nr:DNA polymerase III subunit alpha [Pajaroellobacter abortibovis]APS00864.1 DNA polymerase III subunit alpha [Pajaroellobacter abortibovis]